MDPEGLKDELGRKPADQERMLAVLDAHGVDFIVIGGVAVIAHGYPRLTIDVDILPSPDRGNLARLAAALRELGAHAVGSHGEPLPLDLSHPDSLAVGNYFLSTDAGALDLFNGPHPDLKRYRRLAGDAIDVRLEGLTMRIVSKDDLLAMKREAGRPKDLADIAALTEVERS